MRLRDFQLSANPTLGLNTEVNKSIGYLSEGVALALQTTHIDGPFAKLQLTIVEGDANDDTRTALLTSPVTEVMVPADSSSLLGPEPERRAYALQLAMAGLERIKSEFPARRELEQLISSAWDTPPPYRHKLRLSVRAKDRVWDTWYEFGPDRVAVTLSPRDRSAGPERYVLESDSFVPLDIWFPARHASCVDGVVVFHDQRSRELARVTV